MRKIYILGALIPFKGLCAEVRLPSVEEVMPYVPSEKKSPSRPKGVSCRDVLLNRVSAPPDSDVGLVLSLVYTLCIMEVTMQKYLSHREEEGRRDEEMVTQVKNDLLKLQKILPAFLSGYQAAHHAFSHEFRETLDRLREEYHAY